MRGAEGEVILSDQRVWGVIARAGGGVANADHIKVGVEDDKAVEGVIKDLVKESGLFADVKVSAALVSDVVVDACEHFGFAEFVEDDPCAAADVSDLSCWPYNPKVVASSGI